MAVELPRVLVKEKIGDSGIERCASTSTWISVSTGTPAS